MKLATSLAAASLSVLLTLPALGLGVASVLGPGILGRMALAAQETGPGLPPVQKVRNYLPHMTVPEVRDLLSRSDMVIIPVASLEQHGLHLPIGTDYLNGVERAKLIAQEVDVLVAPILLPGQSPYHMEFEGTVTLPSTLIQEVYVEAAKSLMRHGFKRFLILNAHGGNAAITRFIVDRINQETEGIAVDLGSVLGPFRNRAADSAEMAAGGDRQPEFFDRHGGTPETSNSLYLIPELVDLEAAVPAELTLPPHMEAMLPEVVAGDPTAGAVFLAEGLKDSATGKGTSAAEMSTTGVWGVRDPAEATVDRGRRSTRSMVDAAVAFIRRWNELRPPGTR
jgi:creatinine amidohydrolase